MQLQGFKIVEVDSVNQTLVENLTEKLTASTKYRFHVYGEATVIKIKKENQPKSDEHRITVIFVSYSANHPHECQRHKETTQCHWNDVAYCQAFKT